VKAAFDCVGLGVKLYPNQPTIDANDEFLIHKNSRSVCTADLSPLLHTSYNHQVLSVYQQPSYSAVYLLPANRPPVSVGF